MLGDGVRSEAVQFDPFVHECLRTKFISIEMSTRDVTVLPMYCIL